MIAVTGATGQLGRLVLAALLETVPASNIVAAVRNPEKAADLTALGIQVRRADYSQPGTLTAAFSGVTKLLLISSNEMGQRVEQHRAVIEAAKTAGVQLLAYTSLLRASTSPLSLAVEHKATEEILLASGVPYVFLRNSWYFENQTGQLGSALEHGAILGCAGDGRFSFAARADYAAAAAAVLTQPGHENKIYELGGDHAYTLTELAAEVASQSGKPVIYKDLPAEAYVGVLLQFGLPEPVAAMLADSDQKAAQGAFETGAHALSQLIGRPTTTLAEAVAAGLA